MLTRVPEEIRQAEKAIDFEEYVSQEPLKFQFYYGDNNKAEIINTIYLEDGNNPLKLYLEVFNDSEQDVIFYKPSSVTAKLVTVQAGGAQAASAKKSHFQLRWEKDLGLKPSEIEIDATSEWQVNYDEEDRFFSMYFLHKNGLKLKPNEKIQLGFLKLTANSRTVKSSNVELLYGGIGLIATEDSTASEPIKEQVSSKNAISIINYPSKTQIPLQFRVLGSNAILNDGTSQNTLRLKVFNSPLSNNTRPILLLNQSSKFIVSFERGDHPDALVATTTQLNGVQIAVGDTNSWASEHTANTPQWSFTPKINQLTAGQGIELTIRNLVTSSASGFACIYIDYQNIGSYPDGRLVIPIEKTPLLYSGDQVGVGTKAFDYWTTKFKVNGDIVLGKDLDNRRFRLHTRSGTNEGGEYLQITYDNPSGDWNWNEGITLKRLDGKVGIGTSDPKAKLHVNGGAVIKDNVGIGTTDPKTKLHVNGGDALISGKVGIGMSTPPKIHLAIGDDDTGLQQQGDGQLAIYTNNSERVRVNASGNVGIGTTDPKTKLHVNGGDALISGKVGIGMSTSPKIHLAIGDDDTGLQQQGDGQLAIYTNNAERVRVNASGNVGIGTTDPKAKLHVDGHAVISGNVGIGTNDPKAKLDVNGSVKFGQNGTIINRMICGQVFYNTSAKAWQYRSFAPGVRVVKKSESHFEIYYGFTVRWTQELMILATTFENAADHTACVRGIEKDHCLICIINTKTQYQKAQNFSFMIIHYQAPPDTPYFLNVDNQSNVGTTAPVDPYYYIP